MRGRPALVAHADWSASRAGRAVVLAERSPRTGIWWLAAGDPTGVRDLLAAPRALVGFDAPLGLPRAYAKARTIPSFRAFLAGCSTEDPFWTPVAPPERPSLARPFYPARAGGARRADLEEGLGLGPFATHLRVCDGLTHAQYLFWTLGPTQCGRAALSIWRELLLGPREHLAIWPFDGPLARLLAERRPIVAETYPGLAYRLLALPRFAKRRASDRRRLAGRLRERVRALGARLDPELEAELEAGFAPTRDHGFDALVGCLLLLEIVAGRRGSGDPVPAEAARIEGWMLRLEPLAGQP